MKRLLFFNLIYFIFPLFLTVHSANAAEKTQTIALNPGWTAVFLEVAPVAGSNDPATVFGAIPDLISVWRWNQNDSTVEFIQNPDIPVPDKSTWLTYYHNGGSAPDALASLILTNLHTISGNTAYLIQRSEGVSAVSYTVSGEPVVPDISWKPNSFNLVGFNLIAGSEPTFSSFFAASAAHADQPVYVLRNNVWVDASLETMQAGEAFWIYCNGSSEYNGPLSVQQINHSGLVYGKNLDKQALTIVNDDNNDDTITLTPSTSAPYLYYWRYNNGDGSSEWIPFSAGSLLVDVAAHSSQVLQIGVKRAGFVAPDTTAVTNLVVTGSMQRVLVPVSVTGISSYGLWSGYVTVNEVNEVRKGTDLKPTGSDFSFRLILHVDDTDHIRLLQQVIQMWQEGTWKPDPENLGVQIVDEPGSFILLSDDSLVPQYSGSAMLDGKPVGRRISSSVFGFTSPLDMNGSFLPGGTLQTTYTMDRDDPVNPFVHLYHPKHFKPVYTDGAWSHKPEQMFPIERLISLQFGDTMLDENGTPWGALIMEDDMLNWGSTVVSGTYRETITGLHKSNTPIYVRGSFTLRKISDVKKLTTSAP